MQVPAGGAASLAASRCQAAYAEGEVRDLVVFVHPGMLMSGRSDSQSDHGYSSRAGRKLVDMGLVSREVQLNNRDPSIVYPVARGGPDERFLGLHYSLGGQAGLLRGSLSAMRDAEAASGRCKRYYPILIDPRGLDDLGPDFEALAPWLGQSFVVLSSEGELLRPAISSIDARLLAMPSTHILYAEDFGVHWGHFDVLNQLVEYDASRPNRTGRLFVFMVNAIRRGWSDRWIEGCLDLMKLGYALAQQRQDGDGRPAGAAPRGSFRVVLSACGF